ncbi:MAG TPA: SDR family NAD(P)-dependent oxidoreductase [Dehalococcoidia bacterium]|nr:SDR family NAD(P)-dependent oxidoreductase [Dehalococcoidia bacterium]
MRELNGKTAIVTGASRGLGPYIARALADRGMNLALAARSREGLEAVAEELRARGVRVVVVPADVADAAAREALVREAEAAFGAVHVLVNNAGIESTFSYHRLPPEEIERVIAVNLVAPMLLTRLILPGMLARREGHIVNIASLAGKQGPAYNEPYAASKAGLIGFTQSLRAEYRGTGVSASVVCPGFVREAGMFADASARVRRQPSRVLGTTTPQAVAAAVVRCIERDLPEAVVNPGPTRLLLTLLALAPSFGEWFARRAGVTDIFRAWAEDRERQALGEPESAARP